jgi:tyrosine-protein phosphatase YwqE
VETTHRNHPKYLEILEHIKEKLEKDHLTKVEAVELRQQCYDTW